MADSTDLERTQPLPAQTRADFSRYRLKAELGRGGMGVVWRAEDTKLHRDVALKFLPELVVRDREAMADLAAETRRCLDLTHPNIVRVHDLIEEGDRAAISMELVDGGSLAERKLAQPERCFSTAAIAPWIAQLCSALDYAHTKVRIVHRDLKPLNLLLNTEGDLKVVDFGIARSLLNSGTRLSTNAKAASVSLGYAGPQQLLGEPAAVTDDIYSLGATLFELLTGKPPFYEGDIITQLREVVPPSLAARRTLLGVTSREVIAPEWEETVAACLAKKAADRPQSAGEVAARLGFPLNGTTRFLETAPPHGTRRTGAAAPPPPPPPATPTPPPRRRLPTLALVAVLFAVVGVALFWPGRSSPFDPPASTAVGATVRRAKTAVAPVAQPAPPPVAVPEFVVTVSPPDAGARVWLATASDQPVPADGRLALRALPDGEHSLTVQAPGYQPSPPTRVSVTGGRGTAAVTLVPVFGSVLITARPDTLVIAIDARGREKTLGTVPAKGPLRIDHVLTVGTYLFELEHPDCAPVQQDKVSIARDRPARVAPAQTTLPGELRVFSVPDGAEVWINQKKVGVTPATLPTLPSEKPLNVEVRRAGYRREKQELTLRPREVRTVTFDALTLESGGIDVLVVGDAFPLARAVIRIDGEEVPHRNGRLASLEIGKRDVELSHPDYEPAKKSVTVVAGKSVQLALIPELRAGELVFAQPQPAAFTLTINGKPAVPVDGRLKQPAHQKLALRISAKGYKSLGREITLVPGGRENITFSLEKISVAEVDQPWTVPDLGVVLLPVAGGEFAMGSEIGELTERPITRVTLTQPFWLGKTEVTQREWAALMGANPAKFKGEQHPVENVSWNDAMEFCRKLTDRERAADRLPPGYVYTLPTEAQWEFAARAGERSDIAPAIADAAWHEQNSAETTHPVAQKPANPWGFCDLHGNVWEWCADAYAAKLRGGAVTDPKGVAGADRVRRGGSYMVKPAFLRFAYRGKGEPEFRWYNIGFRLALAPGS